MRPVSPEEYKRMIQDDWDWANRLVQAVKDDPRKFVKYRDPRPIISIKNMIETSAQLYPDHIAFYTKLEKGPYKTITFTEYMADINALGTQLISMGLKENRIAIIGETNYTWSNDDTYVILTYAGGDEGYWFFSFKDNGHLVLSDGSTDYEYEKE